MILTNGFATGGGGGNRAYPRHLSDDTCSPNTKINYKKRIAILSVILCFSSIVIITVDENDATDWNTDHTQPEGQIPVGSVIIWDLIMSFEDFQLAYFEYYQYDGPTNTYEIEIWIPYGSQLELYNPLDSEYGVLKLESSSGEPLGVELDSENPDYRDIISGTVEDVDFSVEYYSGSGQAYGSTVTIFVNTFEPADVGSDYYPTLVFQSNPYAYGIIAWVAVET